MAEFLPTNPASNVIACIVCKHEGTEGWITECNQLMSELIGWRPGEYGDPRDPDCRSQTLIGKPLAVLIPPKYREAHSLFRQAFTLEHPEPRPRTMGEGRDTPIWVRTNPHAPVRGLDSIEGRETRVLIALAPINHLHTLVLVQPLDIRRSFALPTQEESHVRPA